MMILAEAYTPKM